MAYEPSVWADGAAGGTPITAEALNKIEQGIDAADAAANAATTWGSVTGKPSTFPPATHTHTVADVTGLQDALDADVTWAAVTGKPSTFAPATHTHTVADVTGLETRLAALEAAVAALQEPEA